MNNTTKQFVGIDLHKSVLQVCVLGTDGEIIKERRFRGESLEDGLAVVEWLTQWKHGGRFCVEAVGMNRWFVNACQDEALEIVVVDPTKLDLKMLGKKTDRRDAYELARRLRLGDVDRNAVTYFPDDAEFAGRKLVRTRHRLTQLRQQIVNQIRSMLASYRADAPRNQLYRKGAIKRLREISLVSEDLTLCLQVLVSSLEAMQSGIESLSKRVAVRAKAEQSTRALAMLPSIGPLTATTLVVELGDLSRFRNSKAVASYAGLVPRVANSADKSHHGRITKRGNRELRWILTQWSVRLLSFNAIAKEWAKPLLLRMHRNKVRMALARRLLIGIYIMLTRGEVFTLEHCLAH
jgi:transposase